MMWLTVGATEREEINGREEAVGREGAAKREHVEERGGTAEQEGKAGSNAAIGREGATGRKEADEGVKAAERKGTTGREGATERGALDLLRMFRLFITERKGNIHWNVPSRVEASKVALKQLPACHATRGKTEEPYDQQRTTT